MINSLSKLALTAGFALAITFTLSCSSPDDDGGDNNNGNGNGGSNTPSISPCPNATTGNATMSCGGQTYKTVVIGSQTWMAENLNYEVKGSQCYDCKKYGRLYDWATAMGINAKYNEETWGGSDENHRGICPFGWHLPSDFEWERLINFVNPNAATKLKATEVWGEVTEDYGFSALPGGGINCFFCGAGAWGYWWTATENNGYYAYSRRMYYLWDFVDGDSYGKDELYSVRCVQD